MSEHSSFPATGVILILTTLLVGVSALIIFSQRDSLFGFKLATNQDELITQLHQIMELPEATPQVIPIQEVNTLSNSFPEIINDAQNGMIIISYPSQTILYDPNQRKIVKSVSYYLPKPLQISIRFSPGEQARTQAFKEKFQQASPLYKIMETTSSAQIYHDDIVIINNDQRAEEIKILNQLIGNGPLLTKSESSESASPADVYIIFGQTIKPKK